MSYIKKYYQELKELLKTNDRLNAARKLKEKYKLLKSAEALAKAFKCYDEKIKFTEDFEITHQTVDKSGDVLTEKRRKPQQADAVDVSKFEPYMFTSNPFGPGKWIRYDKITGYTPEDLKVELDKRVPLNYKLKRSVKKVKSGVFMLADFHMGAYVGDLLKTPDFNYNKICEMLQKVAQQINEANYKKVHLFLVGDFIESFSGLNHVNSWKGLSKNAYGMKSVILAHDILAEHLYSKIINLNYVGFISGNHDRISSNKDEDAQGQVALMMQYLFNKDFKTVQSQWDALLINKEIDGIGYVVTHGHLGLSNKEITQVLLNFGFPGIYNVFAKGHKHARETKKHFKKALIKFDSQEYITLDSADYRAVTIAPMFTGNFYSESLGYTSTAGLTRIENNGNGKINYYDYCIE